MRIFYTIKRVMVIRVFESRVEYVKEVSLEDERKGLLGASHLMLSKLMKNEREKVMLMLMSSFKRLRYEDLEEVFSDGCLVLWNKMMDDDFELMESGMVNYLRKICWNVGMHYLRKVKDEVVSLDVMMESGSKNVERVGIGEMFDVLENEESDEEEKWRKLDEIWKKLSDVDRMILESYYLDGCKMEEIAQRVGYKDANSVKSKKYRILRKIMQMTREKKSENRAA